MLHRPAPFRTATVLALALAGLTAGPGNATAATSEQTTAPSTDQAGGRCAQPGPYPLPHGSEEVQLDPDDFTTRIDHPYWPMRRGTTWHYRERGGGEVATVRVTVTDRVRRIEGIRARVVHDVVRVDGELKENTFDWYAQDSGGSLWYLGERTREYEGGEVVGTEGSWEHGRDGAQAGMLLPAELRPGCRYREEYRAGQAEDRARVLSVRERLDTPTGFHRRVVQTANTTPLTPDLLENKFYARGLGPVVEVDLSPDFSRATLVRMVHRR